MSWARLPMYQNAEEINSVPAGWTVSQIDDLFEKLPIGDRYDQKSVEANGQVPVIDQSSDGVIGYHNDDAGILASIEKPVVTFANHTCEMRWMTRPFSVIQNVFPMVGNAKCETRFFYYLTKGRMHIEEYKGHYPDFRRLWVAVPPLPEQHAIAAVLGALDEKVEQNRKTSRALEGLARAMFKAWFVDFEPVKAKAAGATSFPGMPAAAFAALPTRFVDSELGMVPAGWEIGTMGTVGIQRRDQVAPADVDGATPYIGLEHMPRRDIALCDWGTAAAVTSSKFRFHLGDVLFGKLRPYFHKVGSAPLDGVCSTDIVVLHAKKGELTSWLLMLVSSDEFVKHTDQTSAGTKMPRTNWKDMAGFPVAIPPVPVATGFEAIVQPMLDWVRSSIHESRKLAELRDYILPKLLAGVILVDRVD